MDLCLGETVCESPMATGTCLMTISLRKLSHRYHKTPVPVLAPAASVDEGERSGRPLWHGKRLMASVELIKQRPLKALLELGLELVSREGGAGDFCGPSN